MSPIFVGLNIGQQPKTDPPSTDVTSPSMAATITKPNEETAGGNAVAETPSSAGFSTSTWSTCSWSPSPCASRHQTRQSINASSFEHEQQPRQRLTFLNLRKLHSSCTRCPTSVKRGDFKWLLTLNNLHSIT